MIDFEADKCSINVIIVLPRCIEVFKAVLKPNMDVWQDMGHFFGSVTIMRVQGFYYFGVREVINQSKNDNAVL